MIRVSTAEFENDIERYFDIAQTQPVIITREGRDLNVLISINDYNRLLQRAGEEPISEEPRQ